VSGSRPLAADVVVVGAGFAGAIAAIAAHDAGAEVLLLEKTEEPGGISVCSFGGVRMAKDAGAALAYLERTNAGATPVEVLSALAQGMASLPSRVDALARAVGGATIRRDSPANYPFPGHETFGFIEIGSLDGFDAGSYPHVRGAPGGVLMFEMLRRNLALRGIAPLCSARATALTMDGGRAAGLSANIRGDAREVKARRAVVLACGGFEGDVAMQRQYWPEHPVLNAAFRGNTGDGVRMAQAVGADLWHMWHYHGSYGFRHPDPAFPFGIRTKRLPDWRPGAGEAGASADRPVRMPWILLDRRGRRFMNEYDPYVQDTGARPLARFDPLTQEPMANPAWLVADAHGLAAMPFGRPTWHEKGVDFEWGPDNRAALEAGILKLAPDLGALAAGTGLPADALAESLARWNAMAAAGADADWGRPPGSMMPLATPPFVYGAVHPIVSNTQGGPVHDAGQRVLRPDGAPIAGLYAAGELGSVFGHLYMSGGNIAECFVGGHVAGLNAAGELACAS
jgi:succinate dehydrogenase/fumarate reductase flavoprotein subunit